MLAQNVCAMLAFWCRCWMREERRVDRVVAEALAAVLGTVADRDRGGVGGRRSIDAGVVADGAKPTWG